MVLHINKLNGTKHEKEKKKKVEKNIKWQPVSNIPVDEIYKDLPEVKQFHDNYVTLWGLRTTKNER